MYEIGEHVLIRSAPSLADESFLAAPDRFRFGSGFERPAVVECVGVRGRVCGHQRRSAPTKNQWPRTNRYSVDHRRMAARIMALVMMG